MIPELYEAVSSLINSYRSVYSLLVLSTEYWVLGTGYWVLNTFLPSSRLPLSELTTRITFAMKAM